MGIRKSRATAAPPQAPRSMVASAVNVPLDDKSWSTPQRGKEWQRELWRLLDIVGEFEYAASWAGSCVSRARLYMADIGPDGDIAGESDSEQARAIAASVLGGPHKRREELKLLGFNLFAVGAAYIAALSARDSDEKDEWLVLSIDDIKRRIGSGYEIDTGRGKRILTPGQDILTYCWTPHPRKRSEANCPARSSRIVLRELEQLTKYVFTQIDSRLIGAGLLPWPAGTETGGDNVAEDLTKKLVELASESLKGIGTAASAVPAIVEVPAEALGKIQLVQFASELSKQALELRREAIRRLALGLDMPPEQLLGMGEANHWSGWYIDESAVKVHIEPLLTRICEALQHGFVAPALRKAGLDPDKYQLWFDTSTLTVRPQRLKDTLDLYVQGLVGRDAVLAAGAYLASDAPSDEEDVRRYVRELVLRDPQLFNQQPVRELLGITEEMMPTPPVDPNMLPGAEAQPALTDSGTPPPPPPAPEQVPGKHAKGQGAVPDTQGKTPRSVTASAAGMARDAVTVTLADATALRALELAGGRLLTRDARHQFRDVDRSALHTVIPVTADRLPALLASAGEHVQDLAERSGILDPTGFAAAVAAYTSQTLTSGRPHSRDRLAMVLRLAGVLESS